MCDFNQCNRQNCTRQFQLNFVWQLDWNNVIFHLSTRWGHRVISDKRMPCINKDESTLLGNTADDHSFYCSHRYSALESWRVDLLFDKRQTHARCWVSCCLTIFVPASSGRGWTAWRSLWPRCHSPGRHRRCLSVWRVHRSVPCRQPIPPNSLQAGRGKNKTTNKWKNTTILVVY